MTRLGYQIPNFTYPGIDAADQYPTIVAQAKAAEAAGFDTVLVMDHFFQLPMIGPPTNDMFECYVLLSALAQHTEKVRLSALVTGNTYRNPAVLAKQVTALDIVSGGRGQLGIGAGWFELEHDAFGIEFGTFTDRFEKLEEALQIILPMLRGEAPTLEGKHYQVRNVFNHPQPLSRVPVMIGGGGEKKTLRMVAQYADESNLICAVDDIDRKLEVLDAHCDRLGRDRSEITVTWQKNVLIAPTHEAALTTAIDFFGARGIDLTSMDDAERDRVLSLIVFGDPDTVGETLANVLRPGLDGFTLNLPANGHEIDPVSLLGETVAPLLAP